MDNLGTPNNSPGEKQLLGVLALTAVVILLYLPSFESMAGLWSLSSYHHGYLIPFISAYLLWQDRDRLKGQKWRGSWLGFLLLSGSVLLWVIATATFVQAVEHFSVILILISLLWTLMGTELFRSISFPLFYLLFAVPVGASIVPYLMEITADVSLIAVQAFGVPVFRDGMLLILPGGNFEVAEACSGFRYLNAGLAIGVLIAYLMFRSNLRRAIYVYFIALVFVLTNGIRAFLVMVIASASDMKYLTGYDHVVFGWVLFLVALMAMITAADVFSDRKPA